MKKILIVDDDAWMLSITRDILEAAGKYEVLAESDGRSAVAAAVTFKPDLAILDVVMPGMDGGEVARALQAQPATRGVPVLFLTSLVTREDQAHRAGLVAGDDYLAKDSFPAELCRRVAELLPE